MTYNRTTAAMSLLREIGDWCARTKTPETSIGRVLFLHPGFVGLMRKRLTLSEDKEIAVRQFIYWEYPDGWRGELPVTHANGTRPLVQAKTSYKQQQGAHEYKILLTDGELLARRVDRDPCQRCGVRHDIGCHHSRAPLGMTL
jgi:hypothetical protein